MAQQQRQQLGRRQVKSLTLNNIRLSDLCGMQDADEKVMASEIQLDGTKIQRLVNAVLANHDANTDEGNE